MILFIMEDLFNKYNLLRLASCNNSQIFQYFYRVDLFSLVFSKF